MDKEKLTVKSVLKDTYDYENNEDKIKNLLEQIKSEILNLSDEIIDICKKCLDKRLSGESIYGDGAQGFNNYIFHERSKNDN